MRETWFMKAPCVTCPFRRDVRPFLRVERAAQISESTWNPYNEFTCHKTLEYDEDADERIVGKNGKTCHGFLAMQVSDGGKNAPEGFVDSGLTYSDSYEMIAAYEEADCGEWEAP